MIVLHVIVDQNSHMLLIYRRFLIYPTTVLYFDFDFYLVLHASLSFLNVSIDMSI